MPPDDGHHPFAATGGIAGRATQPPEEKMALKVPADWQNDTEKMVGKTITIVGAPRPKPNIFDVSDDELDRAAVRLDAETLRMIRSKWDAPRSSVIICLMQHIPGLPYDHAVTVSRRVMKKDGSWKRLGYAENDQ